MAFKVMVHDLVVLFREVELPDRCPGFDESKNAICNADLSEDGALKIFEYQDQLLRGHRSRVPDSGDVVYDNYEHEQGDDHIEVAYHCAECDHEFVIGEFIRNEGSAGLWTDIKKMVSDE